MPDDDSPSDSPTTEEQFRRLLRIPAFQEFLAEVLSELLGSDEFEQFVQATLRRLTSAPPSDVDWLVPTPSEVLATIDKLWKRSNPRRKKNPDNVRLAHVIHDLATKDKSFGEIARILNTQPEYAELRKGRTFTYARVNAIHHRFFGKLVRE